MNHIIGNQETATLVFKERDGLVWLSRVSRCLCGHDGEEYGPNAVTGPAVINTLIGRFEGSDFVAGDRSFDEHSASIAWTTANGALRLDTSWTLCPDTGVLSRNDRLTNTSDTPVTVLRCLSRFALACGDHEVYAQNSRWCNEAQGRWIPLHAGSIDLRGRPGRSTEGGSPYACVRRVDDATGLVFHVLPNGNWTIHVHTYAVMNGKPYAIVELGLSDRDLRCVLGPGETLELPELLVQDLPEGRPALAAPRLHAYANRRLSSSFPEPPVVYNTWFDNFLTVEPDRVREQLEAAVDLGCEVFVIDDGWFGAEESDIPQRIGDWREREGSVFCGKLKEFADEVRAAGLGFGLWVEPEGAVPDMPVRREHPDWFVETESNRARIDLENPDAYAWLRDELARVIETYELAWLKVDFNFDCGKDERGNELTAYIAALHRLWDELRGRCPDTFIEGCASGAMRLDLASLEMCDGHFLSDTVHPTDVIHISQGTLLRIPPGRLARWLVPRAGSTRPGEDEPEVVFASGAMWDVLEKLPIPYAACAALPGIMGLSGSPSELGKEARKAIRWHVDFYKSWRAMIRRSVAHLLTDPRPIGTDTGWDVIQLRDEENDVSLVVAYHQADGTHKRLFPLRDLDRNRSYVVEKQAPGLSAEPVTMNGAELMEIGLPVEAYVAFPQTPGAAHYTVKPV